MTHSLTRYPFPVRPRHRETLDSYSRRVLTANFESDAHRNQHLREYTALNPFIVTQDAWLRILETKTGRNLDGLNDLATPVHVDGASCYDCLAGMNVRYLCTLCAHGEVVVQHPHFEQNVCIKHRRWVGPGAEPATQQTSDDLVTAELIFRKLRRHGLIAAALYISIRHCLTGTTEPEKDDAILYPTIINIINLLTSTRFASRLFDPTETFAGSYELLQGALRDMVASDHETVARRLWRFLRPTFLSIREGLDGDGLVHYPHDFPLRQSIVAAFTPPVRPLEPFRRYLAASGEPSVDQHCVLEVLEHRAAARRNRAEPTMVEIICWHGHRTTARASTLIKDAKTGRVYCGKCAHDTVVPGETSLAMTNPRVAGWFHPTANAPLTVDTIFEHSNRNLTWTCGDGHDFVASASNLSTSSAHGCPVCLNRIIVPGVNDLPSKYPDIAKQWDATKNEYKKVDELASGSNHIAWWLCPDGHSYKETVGNRTRGSGCNQCKTQEFKARSIAKARPDLAEQWHPSANLPLTPETTTVGSSRIIVWICPKGHEYPQRPERRTHGYGCSLCSSRNISPGVNDAQTRYPELCSEWHPYLNTKQPGRIAPGTDKYWWKCQAAGHKYQQSIPHRVKSRGCPECPTEERILANA